MENSAINTSPDYLAVATKLFQDVQSGEITKDLNMLLALGLFACASLILVFCLLALFFRKSKPDEVDEEKFVLESRIQALEIALMDQRNLAISMKNQSKADFAYFKQEMRNIYHAIEGLDLDKKAPPRRLRAASNS